MVFVCPQSINVVVRINRCEIADDEIYSRSQTFHQESTKWYTEIENRITLDYFSIFHSNSFLFNSKLKTFLDFIRTQKWYCKNSVCFFFSPGYWIMKIIWRKCLNYANLYRFSTESSTKKTTNFESERQLHALFIALTQTRIYDVNYMEKTRKRIK